MKARPRSVERNVAKYLSTIFAFYGFSPIERIPVLGRTGPDLTINETNLVIDVKSRLNCPASWFRNFAYIAVCGDRKFIVSPLNNFSLFIKGITAELELPGTMVIGYYDHMAEWCKPPQIPAIVIHIPKKPIGDCMLIVDLKYQEVLCKTFK